MGIKKIFKLLVVVCFVSSIAAAQEMSQDEQMKVWMDYMTPGEVHQSMAKMAGDWKTDNKMWMMPGADPVVNVGAAKIEMLLGGRYMKTTHTGDFMGMPFEGFSLEAYDKAINEFSSIWVDNFGTGMMMMKGKFDPTTKTINYKGTMVDPMQKKELTVREVFTFMDDNKFTMEMYNQGPDGKEFKSMESVFTRK